jgi:O-antigen/teichoic acid export membrane protein
LNQKTHINTYFNVDHLKSDLRQRAVKSGTVTLFAQVADYGIQLVGTMFLARLLSPEDFGLVAMVMVLTGLFFVFSDLGLSDATIQEGDLDQTKMSSLFWINVALNIFFAILVVALAPLIAWIYGEPRIKVVTVVSSLSFLFLGVSAQHIALLKRNLLFHKVVSINLAASFLSTFIAIVMAWRGCGYWSLVVKPIALAFLAAVAAWALCRWRPAFTFSLSRVRSMLSFGASVSGYFLTNYFVKNLDKALIGWRYGAVELGFYSKAVQLFDLIVNQFTLPLHGVAVASLSRLREDAEKYQRFYLKAISFVSFVGMPFCAFLVMKSEDVVLFLYGPRWKKTAEIFCIFGVAAATSLLFATQAWLHASLGRADRLLRWGIVASIPISLAILSGLRFGSVGVATAYTITLILLVGPGIAYAGRPVGLKLSSVVFTAWKYVAASAIAATIYQFAVTSILQCHHVVIRLIVCLVVFLAFYLILTIVLFGGLKPIRGFCSLVISVVPKLRREKVPNR